MSKGIKEHVSTDLVDHVHHLEAVVVVEERVVDDGTEEVGAVVEVEVEAPEEEYTAWTTYETVVDQAVQ